MKEIKGSIRRRYARLPLALALGAMVLTPAVIGVGASEAEASVAGRGETSITLSGDARIRGYYQKNREFGNRQFATAGQHDDKNAALQHRMRVAVDIKAAGGTSLHGRLHFAGADNPAGTTGSMYEWGGTQNNNIMTDYLFFRVPVADATVTTGRQVVNWGHRVKAWDARADRLRADYKLNDQTNIFAYYQKDDERTNSGSDATAAVKDQDTSRYSIGTVYNTSDLRIGAQLRHTNDERDTVANPATTAQLRQGQSGQELFGFATIKSGDLTVSLEADFQFGKIFKTYKAANQDFGNPYVLFLGADYAMGDTTLHAAGVFGKNGWTSGVGGHFDQVSMFYNTSGGHNLGRANFGADRTSGGYTGAAGAAETIMTPTDREYALSIGATHKLSPELSLHGKIAYLNAKADAANNNEWKATAVDASMAYKINASTTYHIDAIYAKPSGSVFTGTDKTSAYWGLGHRFEIRF